MRNWMRELSLHYEIIRNNYPDDKLIILFDIDGTILDMRYTIKALLKSYDKQFNTGYFTNLNLVDINFPEEDLEKALVEMGVEFRQIGHVLDWYYKNRWSTWALNEAHNPFPGVLDVIRWFQLHKNTYTGLNTGRIERLREETLLSLNKLGREYRVRFENDLLMMNSTERKSDVALSKMEGIRKYQKAGYRVVAVIDNEPDMLDAIEKMEGADEILLLHAGSLFNHRRANIPARAIKENVYDLAELVRAQKIPRHIQLVWENVHDNESMQKFLASNVQWADISDLINRIFYSRKFWTNDSKQNEEISRQEHLLRSMLDNAKGARLDLASEFIDVKSYIEIIKQFGFRSDQLWFRISLERFRGDDVRRLATIFPDAAIECQVDSLSTMLAEQSAKMDEIVERYQGWGINRFGISWVDRRNRPLQQWLDDTGRDVVLNHVFGFDAFLQSVLTAPRTIVSDFSFTVINKELEINTNNTVINA